MILSAGFGVSAAVVGLSGVAPWADRGVVSLEALAPGHRRAHRLRQGIGLRRLPPDLLAISDLVLLEAGAEPAGLEPMLDVVRASTHVASDEDLMARFGRWYIPLRQPRYLRRNALVALGNVGDPSEPRVRSAVSRALAHPDPLVRAHAVWCARRLGLSLTPLQGRDDPLVREELDRRVPVRKPLAKAVSPPPL